MSHEEFQTRTSPLPAGFSVVKTSLFLNMLKWRMQNELRAIRDAEDRNDHQELIDQIIEQINVLEGIAK